MNTVNKAKSWLNAKNVNKMEMDLTFDGICDHGKHSFLIRMECFRKVSSFFSQLYKSG
jgi:hypothetical protein